MQWQYLTVQVVIERLPGRSITDYECDDPEILKAIKGQPTEAALRYLLDRGWELLVAIPGSAAGSNLLHFRRQSPDSLQTHKTPIASHPGVKMDALLKALIIQEIDDASEFQLQEVLDFLRFLKAKRDQEAIEDLEDLEDSRAALAEAKEQGTVSLQAFKQELGL